MTSRDCRTYILDLYPPTVPLSPQAIFLKCDITRWSDLVHAFANAANDPENTSNVGLDIAIANAGVSETMDDWLNDSFEDGGDCGTDKLKEPEYKVIDVNLRGVLNFIKLAIRAMRKNVNAADASGRDKASGGSIVITSSATAYAPEQSLPIYSASKLAVCFFICFKSPRLST